MGIWYAAHAGYEGWLEHCLLRRFRRAIMTGANFEAKRYITPKLGACVDAIFWHASRWTLEQRKIADLEGAGARDVGISQFCRCRWAKRLFWFEKYQCVWKSADGTVADGRRRLPIWKEMEYLIQRLSSNIIADRDSVGWCDGQICSDSGGVLAQFSLSLI